LYFASRFSSLIFFSFWEKTYFHDVQETGPAPF